MISIHFEGSSSGFSVQHWVVSLEAHTNDDPECDNDQMNRTTTIWP